MFVVPPLGGWAWPPEIPPKGGTTNFSANLKRESNPELHLPSPSPSGTTSSARGGTNHGRCCPAKVSRRDVDRINAEGPAGWHFKNRVIEGIDHFSAELHAQFFLDDWHRLRKRQVGRHKPRSV